MIAALARPTEAFRRWYESVDSGAGLDRMIEQTDVKLPGLEPVVHAGERAKPRQPFTSGVPAVETFAEKVRPVNLPKLLRVMPTLMRNMSRSSSYYEERFTPRSDVAGPAFYRELEQLARELGALDIGYVTGIEEEIFAGTAIPHDNAIVFTVEMDPEQIATAPSVDAFVEVARGYKNLAVISNALTELLHAHGFAGYPGTALGGLTDYCALAERAGLGAIGYHGLLISPGSGARLRINTIYTNLTDLPVRENPHRWVRDFCASCKNCVRSCPPGAIRPEPRAEFASGKTCIDVEACRPYFARNNGCAVCVKVCPFSTAGYDAVKAGFDRAQSTRAHSTQAHSTQAGEASAGTTGATGAESAGTTGPIGGTGPAGPVALPMPTLPPRQENSRD